MVISTNPDISTHQVRSSIIIWMDQYHVVRSLLVHQKVAASSVLCAVQSRSRLLESAPSAACGDKAFSVRQQYGNWLFCNASV